MVPGLASSPNAALLTSSRPPATSRPDFSTGPYSPRSAALRGASLAFVKAPAKPGPPASTYSGPDGAVTAATRAGSRLSSSSVSSLTSLTDQPDHRGGGGLANAPRRTASRASSRTSMQLEREPSTSRPPSTSGLAATRAVARLQPSRSPSRQPGGSRGGPGRDGVSSGTADEASTPSTASLIGMFEAGPVGTRKAEGSRSGRSSPGEPRIKLAKPAMERRNGPVVIESPQPLRATCSHSTPLIAALAATQRMPSSPAPVEPGPVAASRARGATERPRSVSSPRHDGLSLPHASGPKEPLQPAGEPQRPKPEVAERSSSLGSRKPPRPPPARRMHPHMTGESLADAIVASSLASSRAPSPSKAPVPPPTPPPPRHSSKNHHFFHPWGVDPASRTPSPAKGMRQTMRKPAKSDGEEVAAANHPAARHKKNLVKKHPNKHHEGDRKRWRDEVTERERKRYEGVWAANKGVYVTLPPAGPSTAATALPSANDLVSNIIVRDLWRRSRLGDDVLEEIWELVDRQELKALGREEFVVGMWLIDQRLKGRKLPIKVSRSVWDSVRRMGGVTVR
ncbi:MAG: Increased rDNA silencing protein [Thelocarpon superellum]|nr:MAG: Increased rDNA silencing protein [Thelocarpon superellum]